MGLTDAWVTFQPPKFSKLVDGHPRPWNWQGLGSFSMWRHFLCCLICKRKA